MKGDKNVIAALNDGLKKELTAINQYFLHSRMLEDWGVTKLAKHEYNESIEEMQHADLFIKRILMLGGLPNLQSLDKLMIGENVQEILECDLKLEEGGIEAYRKAIKICEEAGDYVSRDLFIQILKSEEEHADHYETQLELIKQIGIERYIVLNSDALIDAESGAA